jgi:hypothetical protein
VSQRLKEQEILPKAKTEKLIASLRKDLHMLVIETEGLLAVWAEVEAREAPPAKPTRTGLRHLSQLSQLSRTIPPKRKGICNRRRT